MKRTFLFLIFSLFVFRSVSGQELQIVRDTVHHFEIGVPVGWRYGALANNSIELVAYRQKLTDQDVSRENYNVNVLQKAEKDLEKSFIQFKESIGKAEGFKIIEQGDVLINETAYKYLIETHKNNISKEDMHNYVFFTNNEGKIYILTMVTVSSNFERFKDLFATIAGSLKIKIN